MVYVIVRYSVYYVSYWYMLRAKWYMLRAM